MIANIASPHSVRNIETNPAVCVSFVDVFVQKGFKLRGVARNVRKTEPEFATWVAPLEPMKGRFTIHSVIVVDVASVEPILAPSYRFFPDEVTEESQRAGAMQAYRVRPIGS